ncbi:MAG TPA: FecR family protein, partial [bacterium]|nr:FecR family protein [bacterium]
TPTTVDTPQPTPTETPALEYSIEDIKGTALILLDDTTVPESAVEGESVQVGDELITKDNSEMTIALNDNTLVYVEADTQIKVADLEPNISQGFTSRIELLLGNILSEVEKLNESKSSFEIEAGGVVCAVRGTAFEVQKQGDNVSTSTFHGNVEMEKDGHTQTVPAYEHSTYSLKNARFSAQRDLRPSEIKHYRAWVKTKIRVQNKRAARIGGRMPQNRPIQKTRPQKAGNIGKHYLAAKLRTKQHTQHPMQTRNNQTARLKEKAQSQKRNQAKSTNQPKQQHKINNQKNQQHKINHQQNQQGRINNQQRRQNRPGNSRKKKNIIKPNAGFYAFE